MEYLRYVNKTWSSSSVSDSRTANEPAALLTYDWTVSLPPGAVPGEYHLGLVQSNQLTASPLFAITLPPVESSTTSSTGWPTTNPTANATLIYAPVDPTVTVTYWDHACGCSKTSAVASPIATATNLPGTQYTWWDEHCGCTKSAVVPAPTAAPGSNWTAPTPTANVPPPPPPTATWAPAPATPAPSGWTGDANKLISSRFGVAALLAAAVLA